MSGNPDILSSGTYIPPVYGIGLLGAEGRNIIEMEANRLLEIERRILGIEASLEASGIAVLSPSAMIPAGKAKP